MATQNSSSNDASFSGTQHLGASPSSSLRLPYPTEYPSSFRGTSPLSSSTLDANSLTPSIVVTEGATSAKRKRLFHRELRFMMHGFGDDPNPYSETVDLVEDLVMDFVTEMTMKAMEVGKSGKVHVNDIIFLIRKDPKKYRRVKELLMMNEELKKARKAFEETGIET